MTIRTAQSTKGLLASVLAAATIATTPVPAMAQDEVDEARLRKIEAEIRALQRNVFQNGESRFFEPQIAPNEGPRTASTRPTSTTAVTDILARLDAMEQQLQRLTAISEENVNALSGMETRIAALEAAAAASAETAEATDDESSTESNLAAMTDDGSETTSTGTETQNTGPSAERLAAVREIAKPQTDDPGDDDYSYGYRLWNAGFYPEARQALSEFIEQYPDHSRVTYGRNLLGRAYLDDNMPKEAATWFLRNYQTDKQARRAPDSLLFLAEAMIAMEDTRRACIALAEFGETYPGVASGRLSEKYEANRQKVTCE